MLYVVGVVCGVTQLGNIAYVVCDKSPVIKTYSADSLSLLGTDIHVEGLRITGDIVVCRRDRQLYVADGNYCIWRVYWALETYFRSYRLSVYV